MGPSQYSFLVSHMFAMRPDKWYEKWEGRREGVREEEAQTDSEEGPDERDEEDVYLLFLHAANS